MQLELTLAGYASAWRFSGSRTLRAWLERRPWLSDGGLCVIRASVGNSSLSLLTRSIERTAYAFHADEGYLSVRRIFCGGDSGAPRQALMRHFGLAANVNPFEARESIGIALRDRRQLLVISERSSVDTDDWDAFVALVEHYCKASPPVPLAVVVLDTRSALAYEPVCNFITGYAEHGVLAGGAAIDDAEAWARYLHLRSWWDAGGSVSHAIELADRLEAVRLGDDSAVESVLQDHAEEAFRSNLYAKDFLSRLAPKHLSDHETQFDIELMTGRLVWPPPGLNGLHLVPWAARAILAGATLNEKQLYRLRQTLVCAPLASEVLSLCLFFENQIRIRLTGRGDSSRVTPETVQRHASFRAGSSEEYAHYPNRHPAPPNTVQDIWSFASFGELLNSCPNKCVADLDRNVKDLRNCLAHGHYVTWFHCSTALRALRNFDVRSLP